MVKSNFVLLVFLFFGMFADSFAQEPRIFKVEDFDLKGNVKSCLVVTNYGKEEYEFDTDGRLIKSVTRFSDYDYDVTYYKFENGRLIEKRMENYRDGGFEPSTSFGNFYTVDRMDPLLVTEKIFTYDKDFLDSYQYSYDSEGKLIGILRSGTDGEDETKIEYSGNGKNQQQTYSSNGVVQKTFKVAYGQDAMARTEYSEQYLDGILNTATEKVYGENSKLISETKSVFDTSTKRLVPQETKTYEYDENGMLNQLITKNGNIESTQEYIYQYDGEESGNWIKEIITPDNLYTTRRIKYYPEKEVVDEE